jgi:hypothetical protein
VPELNFRHLDDDEAPVATDARLAAAQGRGRVLKRRRTALLTVTTALVLVVAVGGVLGVATRFVPRPDGVQVAAPPGPPTGVPLPGDTSRPETPSAQKSAPTTSPSGQPPPATMPFTYLLLPSGLDPYLVGTDVKYLQRNKWIQTSDGQQCQPLFSVAKPYDPKDVRLFVSDSMIQLVVIAANPRYTSASGAYVGMPEAVLKKIYLDRLKNVVGADGTVAGYYASTPMSVGFWITGGKVSGMIAGSTQDVISMVESGKHLEC